MSHGAWLAFPVGPGTSGVSAGMWSERMNGWVVSCEAVLEVMHQHCTPKPGRKASCPQERETRREKERGREGERRV